MKPNTLSRDEKIALVRDRLLQGFHRKAIASELAVSYSQVNALIPYTGLVLMYATLDERRSLASQRKVAAELPASKTAA